MKKEKVIHYSILAITILAAATTSCEKMCRATITANDTLSHDFKVDGKNTILSNGNVVKVKKGSVINMDNNVYVIETCDTYVIVRQGFTDILMIY